MSVLAIKIHAITNVQTPQEAIAVVVIVDMNWWRIRFAMVSVFLVAFYVIYLCTLHVRNFEFIGTQHFGRQQSFS